MVKMNLCTMQNFIQIAIIDKDITVRGGYAKLLADENKFDIAGEYSCPAVFIKSSQAEKIDVVLLDVALISEQQIDVIQGLKGRYPRAAIILLTMFETAEMLFPFFLKGAAGYFIKTTPVVKLIEMIDIVYSGGSMMRADLAKLAIETSVTNNVALSLEEIDLLRNIAYGKNMPTIKKDMNSDDQTIRKCIKEIYQKLGTACFA
jgi:DNA-binding NarL/FixJ family response regulator